MQYYSYVTPYVGIDFTLMAYLFSGSKQHRTSMKHYFVTLQPIIVIYHSSTTSNNHEICYWCTRSWSYGGQSH